MLLLLLLYMDILGVFTEKHCSKPLEQNVVYILITTLSNTTSHVTLMTSKINLCCLKSDWTEAIL